MRGFILGGADIFDYSFCSKYLSDSFIVCCDAGMKHALKLGITPDIIVGDFDSVNKETFEFFEKSDVKIKKFPCKKDETDMALGIEEAIDNGCDELVIAGGIGSRMDHTVANMQLLYNLNKRGIKAIIVNENNEIQLISNKITLNGRTGDVVSLIPMTEKVTGVTTDGLEYPLNNAEISFGDKVMAVSNAMAKDNAEISIKSGLLYVLKCKD